MKILKTLTAALSLSAIVTAGATAAGEMPMTDGQIKEIREGGEFTIKHGPISNLDMGAMTMVFKASDPAMAKGLKVGDKIKMHVEAKGNKLMIMHMEKAK